MGAGQGAGAKYDEGGLMRTTLQFRVGAFALGIILVAVLVGLAAHTTWGVVNQLRVKFSTDPIESYQIADHFHATLEDLDYTLLRFIVQDDPADWDAFQKRSKELDTWIDDQRPRLTTQRERETLDRINKIYDLYLASAKIVGDLNRANPKAIDASVKEFKEVEAQSQRLSGLGRELSLAHTESLDRLLSQSQRSLLLLRTLIFLALSALVLLCAWLGAVVYREMITPLRLKLVESRAIIERQEKLASLGVLAAGVAHEIRNPLTAIKARLFTLQRSFSKNSPEHEDAATIGREIDRLEKIVRDFLQFARPSEPDLARMTAANFITDVISLLGPQLEGRSVELRAGPITSTEFEGNAPQLKQVLINLIQNGAQSIPSKGTVVLRAFDSAARLGGVSKPVVIIEVTDTGGGIPPEVQKRLFDPFFTTKVEGTGLGLSTAARIMEKHGGAIEFQTQLNRGTTFGMVIPAAPK
jgi:signal transduction histidine kinase